MGLDRVVIDVPPKSEKDGERVVVLLHGFLGQVEDLAPFARSLGLSGRFVIPHGIYDMAPLRGRAWWPIDIDERDAAIARGEPRDLSKFVPDGLTEAREAVSELLHELARESPGAPMVLGGFSQGGMLASDLVLRTDFALAALVLFSSARICADAWRPLYEKRAGLPVFMSHGRSDPDLSFAAATRYKDDLTRAGLRVEWVPFDGGHEIPLVAWRGFKRFLQELDATRKA
jgi:phospholipase/carboxylesterase